MKQSSVKNVDMLQYANKWVEWYESDRKRTAELFKNTLLKMDRQKAFDLDEYNRLIDQSNERDETRTDAKKMARVLAHSWIWNATPEEIDEFNHRAGLRNKSMPIKNGDRLKKASKDDGVKF